MKIYLRDDGTIEAIGYFDYPYACPEFINATNFTRYKCVNIDDIMNEMSWELIEEKPDEEVK